jgi:hypothetical protein
MTTTIKKYYLLETGEITQVRCGDYTAASIESNEYGASIVRFHKTYSAGIKVLRQRPMGAVKIKDLREITKVEYDAYRALESAKKKLVEVNAALEAIGA